MLVIFHFTSLGILRIRMSIVILLLLIVVIRCIFLISVVVMGIFVGIFLHSLNNLFFLYAFSKRLQQIHDFHVFIGGFLECILHPGIRFSPDINKKITGGNL